MAILLLALRTCAEARDGVTNPAVQRAAGKDWERTCSDRCRGDDCLPAIGDDQVQGNSLNGCSRVRQRVHLTGEPRPRRLGKRRTGADEWPGIARAAQALRRLADRHSINPQQSIEQR
jgi:hypothetical protein